MFHDLKDLTYLYPSCTLSGKSAQGSYDCHPHGNHALSTGQCELLGCHDAQRTDVVECSGCHLGVREINSIHTPLSKKMSMCDELTNYIVVFNRNKVLGSWGWVMSIAAALSAFGSLNGTFFSGGRVCFVAAREGHMVRNTFERQTILSKPFFSDVSGSFLCQHLCFFSFPSLIFCPWPM